MAKKYEVITKESLKQIISSMVGGNYVGLPYETSKYFSQGQIDILNMILADINNSIQSRFICALNNIEYSKPEIIDRCFLCDKNDTGGPKCPV